jgi:hypothetical protein
MTQAALGEKLGGPLGKPWSRQAVSAAEQGGRAFTAAEIAAFALVFEVPVGRLLTPPIEAQWVRLTDGGPPVGRRDLITLTTTSGLETSEAAARTLHDLALALTQIRTWASTAYSRVDELTFDLRVTEQGLPALELPGDDTEQTSR